jgi:hypothetical protein
MSNNKWFMITGNMSIMALKLPAVRTGFERKSATKGPASR